LKNVFDAHKHLPLLQDKLVVAGAHAAVEFEAAQAAAYRENISLFIIINHLNLLLKEKVIFFIFTASSRSEIVQHCCITIAMLT